MSIMPRIKQTIESFLASWLQGHPDESYFEDT